MAAADPALARALVPYSAPTGAPFSPADFLTEEQVHNLRRSSLYGSFRNDDSSVVELPPGYVSEPELKVDTDSSSEEQQRQDMPLHVPETVQQAAALATVAATASPAPLDGDDHVADVGFVADSADAADAAFSADALNATDPADGLNATQPNADHGDDWTLDLESNCELCGLPTRMVRRQEMALNELTRRSDSSAGAGGTTGTTDTFRVTICRISDHNKKR